MRASVEAAERRAQRRRRASRRQLARKAGHAAPFLVAAGDNSIPTYGAEANSSEQGRAEESLRDYLDAREEGDWNGACERMAEVVRRQLAPLAGPAGQKGCAAAYAKLASGVPTSARANPFTGRIVALRVKGPHAFALFYGPSEQQYMMPMASEGGIWKVSQIEPIPWPVGASPAKR